jgi:hypothetical protein
MSREDLKDIISRVLDRLQNEAPQPACLFSDGPCDSPCDVTTRYAVGEES